MSSDATPEPQAEEKDTSILEFGSEQELDEGGFLPSSEDMMVDLPEKPADPEPEEKSEESDVSEPEKPLADIGLREGEGQAASSAGKWGDEPSDPEQFLHEGAWRMGPTQVKIFNLGDPSDLNEFAALKADGHPNTAPKRTILREDRQFHNGAFLVYVEFCRIQYMQLIP